MHQDLQNTTKHTEKLPTVMVEPPWAAKHHTASPQLPSSTPQLGLDSGDTITIAQTEGNKYWPGAGIAFSLLTQK